MDSNFCEKLGFGNWAGYELPDVTAGGRAHCTTPRAARGVAPPGSRRPSRPLRSRRASDRVRPGAHRRGPAEPREKLLQTLGEGAATGWPADRGHRAGEGAPHATPCARVAPPGAQRHRASGWPRQPLLCRRLRAREAAGARGRHRDARAAPTRAVLATSRPTPDRLQPAATARHPGGIRASHSRCTVDIGRLRSERSAASGAFCTSKWPNVGCRRDRGVRAARALTDGARAPHGAPRRGHRVPWGRRAAAISRRVLHL